MNKKDDVSHFDESPPKIIEIEDKEIELKKPPVNKIVYYKKINSNKSSDSGKKND